jgi:tryptophan synthase alpha chain
MSRLSEIFKTSEKCFIPFVTAGFPDLSTTREIILRLAGAGSHIVEIGIPFSDPIADGPVIQESSFAALLNQHIISDYLEMVAQIRSQSDVGLVFMTYMNPVLRFGLERLDSEAASAGLDGILISDLTPEEANRQPAPQNLDTIFLAAPTSSPERMESIADASSGFVYLVARTGVTGRHTSIDDSLQETVSKLRHFTQLPIAVGFGISSAADVRRVWQIADGAVVGTAIVRYIQEHLDEPNLPVMVGEYVRGELIPG